MICSAKEKTNKLATGLHSNIHLHAIMVCNKFIKKQVKHNTSVTVLLAQNYKQKKRATTKDNLNTPTVPYGAKGKKQYQYRNTPFIIAEPDNETKVYLHQ